MSNVTEHKLPTEKALDFIQGGKALFTLLNKQSGSRCSYKVKLKKNAGIYFVMAQTEKKMSYIGTIFDKENFVITKNSKLPEDAPQVKWFGWLLNRLLTNSLPATYEVLHSGKCARCGRPLIVPESIKSGFGPECAKWNNPKVNNYQPSLFA